MGLTILISGYTLRAVNLSSGNGFYSGRINTVFLFSQLSILHASLIYWPEFYNQMAC